MLISRGNCAPRGAVPVEWRWETFAAGSSQRPGEAGGAARAGGCRCGRQAAPDKGGTCWYCQTARARRARPEGAARANQWMTPRNGEAVLKPGGYGTVCSARVPAWRPREKAFQYVQLHQLVDRAAVLSCFPAQVEVGAACCGRQSGCGHSKTSMAWRRAGSAPGNWAARPISWAGLRPGRASHRRSASQAMSLPSRYRNRTTSTMERSSE